MIEGFAQPEEAYCDSLNRAAALLGFKENLELIKLRKCLIEARGLPDDWRTLYCLYDDEGRALVEHQTKELA